MSLDKRKTSLEFAVKFFSKKGEELLIFYGHNLWFTPSGQNETEEGKGLLISDEIMDFILILSTSFSRAEEATSSSNAIDSLLGDIFA